MTTGTRGIRWELHARSGRAVLVGAAEDGPRECEPEALNLPAQLAADLHEWAQVVDTVSQAQDAGSGATADVVSRRGRQLAVRLAVETGGQVGYADPLTGEISRVGLPRPAHSRPVRGAARPEPAARPDPRPSGPPTPWATGLTVSAIVAAIVVIALVVVTLGLAEVNSILALFVNLAVVAGFAPSMWLGRNRSVWRWVAFGAAGGIVLAWFALLLSTLG